MLVERRAEERDRCLLEASLRVAGLTTNCVVEDISERGARLRIDSDLELPELFTLALPVVEDTFHQRAVELRWRYGASAGVLFRK